MKKFPLIIRKAKKEAPQKQRAMAQKVRTISRARGKIEWEPLCLSVTAKKYGIIDIKKSVTQRAKSRYEQIVAKYVEERKIRRKIVGRKLKPEQAQSSGGDIVGPLLGPRKKSIRSGKRSKRQ